MHMFQRLLSVLSGRSKKPMPDFRFVVDHYVSIDKFLIAPEELTQRLGLTPTSTHCVGDRLSTRRNWISNGWELEAQSLDVDTAGMSQHGWEGMVDLVKTLHERLDVVHAICPPGEVSFKTIIRTDHACPTVGLELETSQRIVELGATWYATIWPTTFDDE